MSEGAGALRLNGEAGPRLYDAMLAVMIAKHYSPRTVKAYTHWVGRCIRFHAPTHPRFLRETQANAFLTHLAVDIGVAASTQNQAFAAILFLYEHVLDRQLDRIEGVVRHANRTGCQSSWRVTGLRQCWG
jgi:hypothetical protein